MLEEVLNPREVQRQHLGKELPQPILDLPFVSFDLVVWKWLSQGGIPIWLVKVVSNHATFFCS